MSTPKPVDKSIPLDKAAIREANEKRRQERHAAAKDAADRREAVNARAYEIMTQAVNTAGQATPSWEACLKQAEAEVTKAAPAVAPASTPPAAEPVLTEALPPAETLEAPVETEEPKKKKGH